MGDHLAILVLCPECEVSELFAEKGRFCVSCCEVSGLVGFLCSKWGAVWV